MLLGPAGVGKTAILEGLASRIISGEVPEVSSSLYMYYLNALNFLPTIHPQSLLNKRVLSIDLAGIIAGSGVRGSFEEKFQGLVKDIEESGGEVICFIDELRAFL